MKGRRIPDAEAGSYPKHEPGDYGRIGAEWWVFPPPSDRYPNAHVCMLDDRWTFTEEEDETLTVSPSIRQMGPRLQPPDRWHGFLKAGIWTEASS